MSNYIPAGPEEDPRMRNLQERAQYQLPMSPRGKLDVVDWRKIAKGAGIAALGGALAWVSTCYIPQLEDSGSGTAIVVASTLAVLVNIAQKWIRDNTRY